LAVVGVLTSAWGFLSGAGVTALLLAGGGLVAFLIYDYWYSSFGGRNHGRLVAGQPHKFSIDLARKFDVNFDFLTDEGNRAARQLGIAQSYGVPMGMQVLGYDSETVLPTIVITDDNGRILWADETDNYRVRPDPDTYLRVIRTQGGVGWRAR
jgi:hypothetical protein